MLIVVAAAVETEQLTAALCMVCLQHVFSNTEDSLHTNAQNKKHRVLES